MQLEILHLRELVRFCKGDEHKIEEWVEINQKLEIKTIEELEVYVLKDHYSFIDCFENNAHLYNMIVNGDYNKYETITLDDILERLEMWDGGDEEKSSIIEELISLKFGSVVFDW